MVGKSLTYQYIVEHFLNMKAEVLKKTTTLPPESQKKERKYNFLKHTTESKSKSDEKISKNGK